MDVKLTDQVEGNDNEASNSKTEHEVGIATDASKEECGGVALTHSVEGDVIDKDEQVVLDGKGKAAVEKCHRDCNASNSKTEHDVVDSTVVNKEECVGVVVGFVEGDAFDKAEEVVMDGKGKVVEEEWQPDFNVDGGDTFIDERSFDGPNWSLGMTQIVGDFDESQQTGCTSAKMDEMAGTETAPERSGKAMWRLPQT
ncbi:hypothetical protein HanPI659440_Chr04g0171071 [Helianthus annuus]|nr:hypothetical protein HanPI659440_Chr04g0171071 [Helianthus annuus]